MGEIADDHWASHAFDEMLNRDVGGGRGPSKRYACKFCQQTIQFSNRKAFNTDGTPHRCRGKPGEQSIDEETKQQATLFAMAAMNAIVNAQIKEGGVDFVYQLDTQSVAEMSWRLAAAMVEGEKQFRSEIHRRF